MVPRVGRAPCPRHRHTPGGVWGTRRGGRGLSAAPSDRKREGKLSRNKKRNGVAVFSSAGAAPGEREQAARGGGGGCRPPPLPLLTPTAAAPRRAAPRCAPLLSSLLPAEPLAAGSPPSVSGSGGRRCWDPPLPGGRERATSYRWEMATPLGPAGLSLRDTSGQNQARGLPVPKVPHAEDLPPPASASASCTGTDKRF